MKINPGNARGLLVPQGDRPFSFVVYSSEIRDFGRADDSQFGFEPIVERAQLDHVQLNGIGQKKLIAAGSLGNEIQKINLFLIEVVGVVGHRLTINAGKDVVGCARILNNQAFLQIFFPKAS